MVTDLGFVTFIGTVCIRSRPLLPFVLSELRICKVDMYSYIGTVSGRKRLIIVLP